MTILPITRDEFRSLVVDYSCYDSPYGVVVVGSTSCGVCYVGFTTCDIDGVADMMSRFPFARFIERRTEFQLAAVEGVCGSGECDVVFHLYGTAFQLDVWRALLRVPFGVTSTYSALAVEVGRSAAVRAVGSAVGRNPVSVLVPCHRVLRLDGGIGGYYWGVEIKRRILEREINHYGQKHD